VALADLRYLRIAHWGFDGLVHAGELVVAADVVGDIEAVFGQLFAAGFPIRRMRLVDDYGGDDFASIEDDNTSAFNCRAATGSSNWSQHAYGRAIDVNPLENPYVSGGATDHPASQPYLDRSPRPGVATEGGVLVAAFDARGWDWGGRWTAPVDYQHFSATGG
jgi:poly-gamma-glutamate synthesis protein (capsule biosynthesis protein)